MFMASNLPNRASIVIAARFSDSLIAVISGSEVLVRQFKILMFSSSSSNIFPRPRRWFTIWVNLVWSSKMVSPFFIQNERTFDDGIPCTRINWLNKDFHSLFSKRKCSSDLLWPHLFRKIGILSNFQDLALIPIEKRWWNSINQEGGVNWFSKQNVLLETKLQKKNFCMDRITNKYMNWA